MLPNHISIICTRPLGRIDNVALKRWGSSRRNSFPPLASLLCSPKTLALLRGLHLSMSAGIPETYEVGGGPIDPEDYLEYEDRQEVLRSMARLMDDEPQDDQPEPEPPANIERVWPPVIDDEIPFVTTNQPNPRMKKNKTELEHLRDAETGDAYYWQINLVSSDLGALIALVGIIGFACGIILVLTHSSTSLQDKIIACLIFGGGIVFDDFRIHRQV